MTITINRCDGVDVSVERLTIPDVGQITVLMLDLGPGSGKLLVDCYSSAFSCTWFAMPGKCSVREFVASCTATYLYHALAAAREASMNPTDRQWLRRICAGLVAAYGASVAPRSVPCDVPALT